jgi:hypothetical protein
MLVDDNDNIKRLVFVESAGNPVKYEFDGEKVLKVSLVEDFGDAFDTRNSARGYLSTGGSQSKQLRLETRENVGKNEFDSILKKLANPKKAYNLEKISKVRVADNG